MKIAVASENGRVFQHFGRTPEFLVFDVDDGKILGESLLPSGEAGHSALAGLLSDADVDLVLCGGIGGGAMEALMDCGIEVVGGVSGDARLAVMQLLQGTIEPDEDFFCNHHGEEDEGHSCGHSCGSCGHCGHHCSEE